MLLRRSVVLASLVLCACGDNADQDPADAGVDAPVDADPGECGGKPDGTPCGNTADSECDHADTCQAGACVANLVAANTACGDTTESDCNHADTCDGAGACQANIVAANTACGDTTENDCNHADTCDGAGACQANLVAADTACGDTTENECDLADTCDGAGACLQNFIAANTACGDPTVSECNLADACDGAGVCAPNFVAANTACGDQAATDCDHADSCDGAGACGANKQLAGTACYDCAAGPGRCAECSAMTSCDDGPACIEPSVPGSLTSTFLAGNNHRGNMFNVTAIDTLVITGFDAHPMGDTTIAIYYKLDTYAGFEANSAAWTLIGSAQVTAQPYGAPTPVPVPVNVTIPAGMTYAFYVTSTATGGTALNYTDGNSEDAVYTQDGHLQFRQGIGLEYPFAPDGRLYRPRVWNGVIHYTVPDPDATLDTHAGAYTGGTSNGVMFDVAASKDVLIRDQLSLELTAGTHDVDVYFRRGSFVGHEASVNGWEHIGTSTVSSAGDGSLSAIALDDDVFMSAGETVGFYVDTGATTAGLRTDDGGTVGDVAATGNGATLAVGRSTAGMFGTAGGATTVRGELVYPVCVVVP